LFWVSVGATLRYTLLTVPIQLVLSLFFAVLINQKIFFRGFFRTVMYFPSMISGVAMSLLWLWIFNPQTGAESEPGRTGRGLYCSFFSPL
jgi:multiple sugar transport system permease protein